MMNRLTNSFFATALLFSPLAKAQEAADDFEVAVVDIQKVFKSYYKTAVAQKDIDRPCARIHNEHYQSRVDMGKLDNLLRDITAVVMQ